MENDEILTLLESLTKDSSDTSLPEAGRNGFLSQLPALASQLRAGTQAAPSLPTPARTSSGSGPATASSFVQPLLNTAGKSITLLPLIGGLLKLFGVGKSPEAPPPLEKFELPPPIRVEAALDRTGDTYLVDRGRGDEIRRLPVLNPQRSEPAQRPMVDVPLEALGLSTSDGWQAGVRGATINGSRRVTGELAAPSAPQITVNVQAMDSRSFLDRREDIARAVREAMLQSHGVNDVVNDL
jgi:hypothetical protein